MAVLAKLTNLTALIWDIYTEEPCLTVARTGSAGFVAYQPNGCVVGDSAKILILKDSAAKNPSVYLFMRTILMANQYKYTYGRKVTEDKYLVEIVMLPVANDGSPNWSFMEQYVKSLNYRPLLTSNSVKATPHNGPVKSKAANQEMVDHRIISKIHCTGKVQ